MTEFIVLLAVSTLSLGILLFQVIRLQRTLAKLNFRMVQNGITTRVLCKKTEALETAIDHLTLAIQQTPAPAPQARARLSVPDELELQYEKARKLAKSGRIPKDSLQKSCKLTEEEYELLMDSLQAE